MIPAELRPIADHLWQSTLFVAAVWLVQFALRKNCASTRHRLWIAASIKFLIPFALLTALGGHIRWRSAPAAASPQVSIVIDEFVQPFATPTPQTTVVQTRPVSATDFTQALIAIWLCGFLTSVFWWTVQWLKLYRAKRRGRTVKSAVFPIPVVECDARIEPGVFGILKPALLVPEGITQSLTAEEFAAVLAHEQRHVERLDNLTASIHMLVESLFWFHPLVWWINGRIVDEQERACDEEVLRLGQNPEVYARSILKICQFYVTVPLACMSGISGADLKKRIGQIMTNDTAAGLSVWTKALLTITTVALISVPMMIGSIRAQSTAATSAGGASQAVDAGTTFEAASIKRTSATDGHQHEYFDDPTHIRYINQPLKKLIEFAYRIPDRQLVAPDWLGDESFDITAVAPGPSSKEQMYGMLRSFLTEQFKLQLHHEAREQPVYALVVAKGGIQMSREDAEGGSSINTNRRTGHLDMVRPVAFFIQSVANYTDRPVIDRTGLDGIYHFKLSWTLDQASESSAADPNDPPQLFTAIEEQLGLKLTPQRGPVDTIVIDHCEKTPAGMDDYQRWSADFTKPMMKTVSQTQLPATAQQRNDGMPPRFEVASIKVSKNPAPGGNVEITPGRFHGKDLALQWLILTAYRLKSGNLLGNLPNWTSSERYDVEAETGTADTEDRVLLALQTLLIERFQLTQHRETRDEPVYFLNIDKNGIKMPSGSCVPVKRDYPNECWHQGASDLVRVLDWRGVPMSDPGGVAYRTLAGQLSSTVNRAVIDKTGLKGTFDVHLRWMVDPQPGQTPDPNGPNAPSIFDALREQLGLSLESGRGPVEYMVVDRVERPTTN